MTALDLDPIRDRLSIAMGIGLDESVARHYRQDVPALVAEVERLSARLVEIEGVHIEGCWRNCGKFPCSCECHASKIRYGSTDGLVTSAVVTKSDNDDSARHFGSTALESSVASEGEPKCAECNAPATYRLGMPTPVWCESHGPASTVGGPE